jgi:hypothetical protein
MLSFFVILSIIFYRDPIDDELKQFFMCANAKNGFSIMNFFVIMACLFASTLTVIVPLYAWHTASTHHNVNSNFDKKSISWVMAFTPDEIVVDIGMILSNVLLLFISLAREIQIRVIFTRSDEYKGMMPCVNVFNCILLCLSAILLILAAIYNSNGEGFSLHTLFAVSGWGLGLLYHLIHIGITLKQRRKCFMVSCNNEDVMGSIQVNMQNTMETSRNNGFCCKYFEIILLGILWFIATICSILFVLLDTNHISALKPIVNAIDNLDGDLWSYHFYEWVALWCIASFYVVFGIIFYRDPVNDELKEFFGQIVCICCSNKYCLCLKCRTRRDSDSDQKELVNEQSAV